MVSFDPVKAREVGADFVTGLVAVMLGLFIASGADVFAVSLEDLRTWLAAGLAASLPVFVSALRPADPRYGVGSSSSGAEAPGDFRP